jgi:hypothetical protein
MTTALQSLQKKKNFLTIIIASSKNKPTKLYFTALDSTGTSPFLGTNIITAR